MVLLVGAGLMINTIFHLQRVNPGFDVNHVLSMDLQLPEGGKYLERVPGGDMEKTLPSVTAFYQRLLEKTGVLPAWSRRGNRRIATRCCPEFYSFAILGRPAPPPEIVREPIQ